MFSVTWKSNKNKAQMLLDQFFLLCVVSRIKNKKESEAVSPFAILA